jgi:hypothetical protein
VTRYLTVFNTHLIGWQTKKQPVASLSSCEAEYCALTDFACKLLWLQQLINEINIGLVNAPTTVHEDNQGCIVVAKFDSKHKLKEDEAS